MAESIEISEMWSSPSQGDEKQTLERSNPSSSIYSSKEYTQKSTTKQDYGDRQEGESSISAAATSKETLEGEKDQEGSNSSFRRFNYLSWSK